MDVCYTLGKGSKLKDFELRMSIRSVEKYLGNVGKVWIIGEIPEFIQNVNHIPAHDLYPVPDRNIMTKLTIACNQIELTESFLFMNDDHFLLDYFDADNFPYFYDGDLQTYCKKRGMDGYGRRAANSLKTLQTIDLPTKYFDIHTPITYNKELFQKHVSSLDWTKEGYIIKSLYGNAIKTEGVQMKDNKISMPPKQGDKMFSTFPQVKASVTRFLTEQFPEPSKFEKWGI